MFKKFLDWWRNRKKAARHEEERQLYIADLEYKMAREQLQRAKEKLDSLDLQLLKNPDSHSLHLKLPDAEKEFRDAERKLEWWRGEALYRRSRFRRRWGVSAPMYDWSAV